MNPERQTALKELKDKGFQPGKIMLGTKDSKAFKDLQNLLGVDSISTTGHVSLLEHARRNGVDISTLDPKDFAIQVFLYNDDGTCNLRARGASLVEAFEKAGYLERGTMGELSIVSNETMQRRELARCLNVRQEVVDALLDALHDFAAEHHPDGCLDDASPEDIVAGLKLEWVNEGNVTSVLNTLNVTGFLFKSPEEDDSPYFLTDWAFERNQE